jgi:hypothetical protein
MANIVPAEERLVLQTWLPQSAMTCAIFRAALGKPAFQRTLACWLRLLFTRDLGGTDGAVSAFEMEGPWHSS